MRQPTPSLILLGWLNPLVLLWIAETNAWISVSQSSCLSRVQRTMPRVFIPPVLAKENDNDNKEDDDDDDDDIFDEVSLGDWRKFRASLINDGISTSGGSATRRDTDSRQTTDTSKQEKASTQEEQPLNPNAALLEQQNQTLADEYRVGVWAHPTVEPEVGGLMIRLPLEAELYYGTRNNNHRGTRFTSTSYEYWKDKVSKALQLTGEGSDILQQAEQDLTTPQARALLRDAKVKYWFQTMEKLVRQELVAITTSGKVQNGILDPNDLDANQRLLMAKYLFYKQTWQEVCLLLQHQPESGISQAVVINRPISTSINKSLAKVLLEGTNGSGQGTYDYEFCDQFVQAFGTKGIVYKGGPDGLNEPAMIVHGLANLEGATQVAPGTGLYTGGIPAAVQGVLDGTYSSLDFRFFLGRQDYSPTNPKRGALLQHVLSSAYQPVACARPLALKQCLALPKPLWHEVLELCGGELKSLSDIELQKRVDLQ